MIKRAYQMGNLQALHSLGMIPNESLQNFGFPPSGGSVGLTPYVPGVHDFPTPERSGGWGKTLRKIGPAAGTLLGSAVGLGSALLSKRLGGAGRNIGKKIVEGAGTGALAGWLPDVFATASEELSS